MPLRFTTRIVEHLAYAGYRPTPRKKLVQEMNVSIEDRKVFDEALDHLLAEALVEIGDDDFVRLPEMGAEVVGRFRLNARGFGFVVPQRRCREGDLFIPLGRNRDAISGDVVRATVLRQPWRARAGSGRSGVTGEIVEVLERGQEHFVGVLVKRGRDWYVEPDGRSLYDAVVIRDPHAKNAKAGDKVVIELLHYPEEEYHAEGVITKVLGEAGRPDVETQAVIEAHGLRTEFPEGAVREAQRASSGFDGRDAVPEGREDFSSDFIFTIDPPDAKDFDDAISIHFDEDASEWTLGVHIADVAHFVRPGSALDDEAIARGNSTYLPRLVIPMLPEVLSNGVCSLQEGVPRLTKSLHVTFDRRGKVLSQRASAGVIRSRKRLTYLEAQALIDGDEKEARKHARTETSYSDELRLALGRADQLARLLRARRKRDGMIVLNLPEVELVFDDAGHVVDAVPEDDAFTHTIIEMFMVEANEAVARLFDGLGVPVLRRIHPDPKFGAMQDLRMYAASLQINVPEHPTRQDLQRLLDVTRESPAARALHFAVLRTLTKASYSPAAVGHYALASDHYAHFTSPIRRYPDLTVHRALEAYLDATDNGRDVPGGRKRQAVARRVLDDERVPDEGRLLELGRHFSDTEIESEAAERELRSFLVMQFLQENHLGDDFTGIVTGVTNAGVFVSIERFLVEGLVKPENLSTPDGRPDRWKAQPEIGRLVAARTGLSLGLGDLVTVRIVQVNLASRQLDLLLVEMPAQTPRGGRRGKEKPGAKRRTEKAGAGTASGRGKGKGYKKGRRGRKG